MSLCLYVTGTTLVLLFTCTGTVGTVGTLVPATLCLCTNMLLVPHWYCSLYVLVLLFICTGTVVHWYQRLYVSVPICYLYRTGTALYMYWYCWYCWYTGTSNSMSPCLYVTGTTLVVLFICTGTVGTLVPATLRLCGCVAVPVWLLYLCACVAVVSLCLLCLCGYMVVCLCVTHIHLCIMCLPICVCVHIIMQMKSLYCHIVM